MKDRREWVVVSFGFYASVRMETTIITTIKRTTKTRPFYSTYYFVTTVEILWTYTWWESYCKGKDVPWRWCTSMFLNSPLDWCEHFSSYRSRYSPELFSYHKRKEGSSNERFWKAGKRRKSHSVSSFTVRQSSNFRVLWDGRPWW